MSHKQMDTRQRRPGGPRHQPSRRPSRSGPGADRRIFAAALLVAVPVLIWAGVRLAGRDRTPSVLSAGDPGISHVHGLGLDPVDDSLYVATHYGTFRLGADKKGKRIGDSYQDTMGFTVAGARRLLGSGHPGLQEMRQGKPPRLGLIESTDGGATWQPLSLSGEVDFHALGFSHDRIYGWDASTGRFMVSTDGRSWDSTLPLAGFAVDPANPEHIVGASSTPASSNPPTEAGTGSPVRDRTSSRLRGSRPAGSSAPTPTAASIAPPTEATHGLSPVGSRDLPKPCS